MQRVDILHANTLFSFQKDTAYWADNWTSVLSTTFYTISMLLFINVLYTNVNTIVGYTKNDMLLFFLIGQMSFYLTWSISAQNMQEFIEDVNQGNLDLMLTKPIPALFYITFKRVRIVSSLLRDGIPPTLAVLFSIDWSLFHFSIPTIITATLVFFLGQICLHVVQFISVLPVIWQGESGNIFKLGFDIENYAGRFIPNEGFPLPYRIVFGIFIPVLISTGFTTSILLQKINAKPLLLITVVGTVLALFMRQWLWNIAIRNYTSASS